MEFSSTKSMFDSKPDDPNYDPKLLPSQCVKLQHEYDHNSWVFDTNWITYLMIGVLFLIYASGSIYFFVQRKKVSFMTRSPITVSISLFLLGADSILNTLSYSSVQYGNIFHWQCNLGIVSTLLGQFGFSIATGLRIFRISKVYNTYMNYLQIQKDELSRPLANAETDDLTDHKTKLTSRDNSLFDKNRKNQADSFGGESAGSDLTFDDSKKYDEIGDLKEQKILCKGFGWFFTPFCIMGALAMFFPSMYALFPVQESEFCICSFFTMQVNQNKIFPLELNHDSFYALMLANGISYFAMNWIGLLILVLLVYRIRHT